MKKHSLLLLLLLGATGSIFAQLNGYNFWRSYFIRNVNSTTYTNVQVLVTVNTAALIAAGRMQPNGNDIRFTTPNSTAPLWHFVAGGLNTTQTQIWVKVPNLPGLVRTELVMHYGNVNAANASNGDSTFIFFDDFNTGSLNTQKWPNNGINASIVDSANQFLRIFGSGNVVLNSRELGVTAPFIINWRTNGFSAFSWDLCGTGVSRNDGAFSRITYFSGVAARSGSGFSNIGTPSSITANTQITTTSCDSIYNFTSRVYANGAYRIFHPRGSDTIPAASYTISNATRVSYQYFYNSGNATGVCNRGRLLDQVYVRRFVQNEPVQDSVGNELSNVTIFYAKASGALDSLTSWGRNADGTGVSPTSFNEPNTFYIVTNNNNPTLSNNWFVTGNNTAIIVNGGYNLVVPAQFTFGADSIVVLANATITLNGNLFANKAFFDTLSNAQYTGIVPQNILGFNYFNLTVSGSVKTLANHTTARNFLTMLSNINTNGFNLTVGSSAGNTGNINLFGTYIIGKLTRWIPTATQSATLLFPVGTSNNYLPAQLIFNNNLTAGGTISCEFISGNPGNGGLPLFDFTTSPVVNINKAAQNGVWRFEAANGLNLGTTNFNITLNASGFWGVNNYNELRIIRRPVSGSWNIVGNAGSNMGSNQSPIVVRNAVNLFGDFTIGGDLNNNPLPVGLTRFSGNWMNNHIILNWQTAFEENASGFTIEKLANNQWIEAGFVPAKGNTSRITNYTFTDENPALKQDNYYRLKLLDIDHAFEYSKVIVVNQNQPDNLLNIWPNPAGQQLHINGLFESTLVEVYNQNGKLVKTSTTTNQLNISELENGLYFIKTNGQTARFLKVE